MNISKSVSNPCSHKLTTQNLVSLVAYSADCMYDSMCFVCSSFSVYKTVERRTHGPFFGQGTYCMGATANAVKTSLRQSKCPINDIQKMFNLNLLCPGYNLLTCSMKHYTLAVISSCSNLFSSILTLTVCIQSSTFERNPSFTSKKIDMLEYCNLE